ncbi:SHOCT domain-containing protein [Gordonia bronchialis]|uniref:SHOCT domain-containing protein n=1 Tax=Gordonia bronchialis TaxID=2054 RepID=UPI00226D7478|nr:SHOCT domain-containing protein [Gordonia bronchialis]
MPGLIRGVARTAAIAGTATAVSNRVSRRQANRWAQQEQERYTQQQPQYSQPQYAEPAPAQPAPAQPAPAAPGSSTIDQLKELAALYQRGILTDDEFAAQKAKILAS